MSVLRLAIATPLRRLFDYLAPPGISREQLALLQPGQRLRVPFGNREVTGILLSVESASALDDSALKAAQEVLDPEPLVDATLLQLGLWAADYYQHPAGEVLSALFPTSLRKGKPHQRLGEPAWQLTVQGKGLPEGALARSPRQSQALAMLQQQHAVSRLRLRDCGISPSIMAQLRDKGLVEACDIEEPVASPVPGPGLNLNPEQETVLSRLASMLDGFSCHLLEGITGSGKTEIYLQLISACLKQGKQALILIPEIGLTPQTLQRFQQRFTSGIAVLHSGLSDTQRYRAWEAARTGNASILIGTRSAVFVPMQQPGLIIVDEEHDDSYKQQDGFRYSARDVAIKRAQLSGCPVLLGSATPSLESINNVQSGRYQLHRLTQRAGSGRLPDIQAVDIRRQALRGGLSETLVKAVDDALQAGQQA
ncbi:MAG: primosomal protein N', partial [Gammaproteobacteria bacterium]|nr:primosomal protein N' [Gammaproteobacteria bacterium]